jgi:hypothetical protein
MILKAGKMFAGISGLDLAIGIKEMLINHGFSSLDALLKLPPAELALILGIDLYVARLIYVAAKRHIEIDKEQHALNDEAFLKLEQKRLQQK